jgi:predicted small lipoprotein YifL
MKNVLMMLAMLAMVAGCGRTAMYDAPDSDDVVAVIQIANHIGEGKEEASDDAGGWQMPVASAPARAGVFKVDGERTNEMGGDAEARLKPGEHTIQVFADDAGVLRFGDITWNFKGDKTYVIHVYSSDNAESDYRGELVEQSNPDKVLTKVNF